ncbi:hypothetical protein AB0O90_04405 [Microbacterium testaceum]|uniref:hypothetical protein n=1 Tax=Microbacterium testaceum TaxID=2033 RepID=UPI00343336D8
MSITTVATSPGQREVTAGELLPIAEARGVAPSDLAWIHESCRRANAKAAA